MSDMRPLWCSEPCWTCGQEGFATRTERRPKSEPYVCSDCESHDRGYHEGKRAGRIEMAEEIRRMLVAESVELCKQKEHCCAWVLEEAVTRALPPAQARTYARDIEPENPALAEAIRERCRLYALGAAAEQSADCWGEEEWLVGGGEGVSDNGCQCAPCWHARRERKSQDLTACLMREELRPYRIEKALEFAVQQLATKRGRRPLWSRVGELCGLGSNSAAQLCIDLGFDPDTGERR